MVAFTPIVQADFSGTAFGGAPTWTDITRFVRLKASPITINKWRQDELSDVAPSTATIVLDNDDLPGDATAPNAGRFTPDLATSPFYPRIVPGVRMRVGVTVNATTYWLIDGYTDSWDAGAEDGDFPTCTVIVNDILAQFGSSNQLRAIYLEEALLDAPLALWPLTESSGATSAGSIAVTQQPVLAATQAPGGGGDYTFGNAKGVPTDSASALALNESLTTSSTDDLNGYFFPDATPSAIANSPGTITYEAWIIIAGTLSAAASRYLIGGQCAIPVLTVSSTTTDDITGLGVVWDNASSKMLLAHIRENSTGKTYVVDSSGFNLNDGQLHHVVITVNNTPTFYIDGVSRSSSVTLVGAPSAGSRRVTVGGRPISNSLYGHSPLFRGVVQGAGIYGTNLAAARITAHYTAGATAFAGEATNTHVTRLLSYRTNLGSSLDVGNGNVGAHQTTGITLQQALLETGKAEGGLVYVDGTGKVVLLNRARLRDPAVAVTLDITAQQTGADLRYRKDRQQVVNEAVITRAGGATQRVLDTASQSSDGVRTKSDTLIVATDTDARNAAGWIVANGKTPRTRSTPLTVDLLTEPSTTVAQAVLSLAPLQRVAFANAPSWAQPSDVIVQGVTWTLGVDVFGVNFFTSPLARPTLRFDATADSFTKLDSGNVFAW